MTNGERIKYLREKNGYTQRDIATKLGLEPAAISKYELDMREPNIEALKKLATLFNVSIDYLLGRTPNILISQMERNVLDIAKLKQKYELSKSTIKNIQEQYENENAIIIAKNELCTISGKTIYGDVKSNTIISVTEIEHLINDIENAREPKPQILLKLKNIENGVIIVELDSFDDKEIPISATERIELYTIKFSREYNVLGLAISIDKNENCKLVNAIYQEQNSNYYTTLHLPRTVLTAGEYIDIMSRL